MIKILFSVVTIIAVATLYSPATQAKLVANNAGCLNENAQITINFNNVEPDLEAIKGKFDGKVTEIKQIAKTAGLEQFDLQSMNYNISPQNYNAPGTSYNFSGNLSFRILPANKAVELMAILVKKGYMASVNVNAYNNNGAANCNASVSAAPVTE